MEKTAVMLLNTAYTGQLKPEASCPVLPGTDERKLPYCIANKSEKEPKKPHTVKEAIAYPG